MSETMKNDCNVQVTIRLHRVLRRWVPEQDEVEVYTVAGGQTVAALIRKAGLSELPRFVASIDNRVVPTTHVLDRDSELFILPPFAGG